MIRSLADETTKLERCQQQSRSQVPRAIWPVIRRKLDHIDTVATLGDLRVPPCNRFHALDR